MRGRHGTKNTASKYIKKGMIPAEILVGLSCRLLTKRRTRKKKNMSPTRQTCKVAPVSSVFLVKSVTIQRVKNNSN